MSQIKYVNTDGDKSRLLPFRYFGLDNYLAGGDIGRVYIGTGSENIPLAKQSEVLAIDDKADAHIDNITNPHEVTKAQVGLSNVENLAPADMPISSDVQAALDDKANKTDADLLGTPTAPTASVIIVNNQIATTEYVANKVASMTYEKSVTYTKAEVDGFINAVESSVDDMDTDINDLINDMSLKSPILSPVLTGEPKAPTAAVGTNSTQLATTEFVGAEIADKTYSKTQLDSGELDSRYYTETELDNGALDDRYYTEAELDSGVLDNRYYTETELLNGALDVRYYTEAEVDSKLAGQNAADNINYDGTVSELIATNVQDAIDEVEHRLGVAEGVVASINLARADKYLAAQNVVKMIYNSASKLSKVRYNNDTDVDYEVLTYDLEGKLSNVAHYIEGTLRGNTTLNYENGKLVASPYTAV